MFNETFTIGVITLIIMVVIGMALFPSASIAKRIDNSFKLDAKANGMAIYNSSQSVNSTFRKVRDLKNPYDVRVDSSGKNFMLYEDYIVVLTPKGSATQIEVMRHQKAYNRYHGPIVNYWGGNLRNGSIGRPSSRGGGFGFGK
ncbi:DUF4247 domain-containing protein [Orenia marismortui]|uniref:Uncharacterized protein DUF4247 n=1 Tax=Orenia marismortui TaxID=46469 RepID=A0A4R8H7N1_9FIRM|nr:DUF4247 domain-containing protein [Orenia marismortui]TDX51537.1 uncharacterized protein DUF4247 [Orenia marismortui]